MSLTTDQQNPMIPQFGNDIAGGNSSNVNTNDSAQNINIAHGETINDSPSPISTDQQIAPSWSGLEEQSGSNPSISFSNQPVEQTTQEGLVPDEIQITAQNIPDMQVPPPPPPTSSQNASFPMQEKTKSFPKKIIVFILIGLLFFTTLIMIGKSLVGKITQNKQVSITYWGMWEDDVVMQTLLSDFQSTHPNISVTYVKNSPKQYRERIQNYIRDGNGPDVFRFHNTWVAELRDELDYVPSSVMTTQQLASDFFPVVTRDLVAGNVVFGIPMMIDGLGLYYNEDLFAAAGASPPTTWEDVFNLVPKLTVRSDDRITTSAISLGTLNNIEHWSDILALMFMQNGVNLVNPVGPDAENTLAYYRKFADPSNTEGVYTWNDTLDNNIYAFANGRVAMILAPSWRAFDISQINPDLRFRITSAPQLPGHTVTWASYWVEGVSKQSKQKDAAWAFVKYLTSKETMVKLYTESSKVRLFGEPYSRIELAKTIEEDPYVGAYVLQAKDARSFPLSSRTFDNGLNDQIIKYLEDAYTSYLTGTTPTAAMQTYASGVNQVLTNYKLISASQSQ
jgi:multiple sugar transport system substrate-binding protein